ncbi:type II toxin-antitoxin system HicA family toxin [Enterococcus sp. 669A]|uniref:Type II toxin-antitoxin system HicA family toxin n=1 Tax=Candidatus Enterococcus moelleringii TaxID=2815325 RepID=A0ABS3LAQ4_9ENTE|nr:type II toxin-antitoxin system HicA family toxin [Enterococcus sp. 669A]
MRNNPKNVSKEKLITILRRFGCTVFERSGGSHFAVSHPKIERTLTIPSKKPIKAVYIRDCVRFIDEVKEIDD